MERRIVSKLNFFGSKIPDRALITRYYFKLASFIFCLGYLPIFGLQMINSKEDEVL